MTALPPLSRKAGIGSVSPLAPGLGLIVHLNASASGRMPDRDWVASMLAEHGVLLFRKLAPDLEGFKAFTAAHSSDFSNYRGGGLRFGTLDRQAIGGDETVLSVTGHSQGFGISLHGEMYYMPSPPEILWFYCHRAPAKGGQTIVGSANAHFSALAPSSQDFFRQNLISYRRTLRAGDWQKAFMTGDLAVARQFAEQAGLYWSYDASSDTVHVSFDASALREHAGASLFINNILFIQAGEDAFHAGWAKTHLGYEGTEWPFVVRRQDGTPIPPEILADIARAERSIAIEIEWQAGDIVMIDNLTTLHGRRSSQDTAREIYVRMAMQGSFAA